MGTKMKNIKYISIAINTPKWEIAFSSFVFHTFFFKKPDMMQIEGKLF